MLGDDVRPDAADASADDEPGDAGCPARRTWRPRSGSDTGRTTAAERRRRRERARPPAEESRRERTLLGATAVLVTLLSVAMAVSVAVANLF